MSIKAAPTKPEFKSLLGRCLSRTRVLTMPLVLAATLLAMGCHILPSSTTVSTAIGPGVPNVAGSRELVTEPFQVADFTGLRIRDAFRVDVYQEDSFRVEVTADNNLMQYVRVEKVGETLHVGLQPGTYRNATLRARVGVPRLSHLDLSGASRAELVSYTGSALALDISGASDLTGRLDVAETRLSVGGASKVLLSGRTGSLSLFTQGASQANLDSLQVGEARVQVAGASRATVNVKTKLDADVSGASTLRYTGEPRQQTVNTRGASSVKRLS